MTKLFFALTFVIAIFGGIIEGEALSLIRRDGPKLKHENWNHGIVGGLMGWLFGCALPTLPEFRPWFALFTAFYGAGIYLFLHLFFINGKTKRFGWEKPVSPQ
jgi:hypothetical protein